jgi:hypothetical protein
MKRVRGWTCSIGQVRNSYGVSMGISERKKLLGKV